MYIEKQLNDVNYVIKLSSRGKDIVAHIDRLKPFVGDELPKRWEAFQRRNAHDDVIELGGGGNTSVLHPSSDVTVSNSTQPAVYDSALNDDATQTLRTLHASKHSDSGFGRNCHKLNSLTVAAMNYTCLYCADKHYKHHYITE